MLLQFSGEVVEWRGPAPHYFVVIPEEPSAAIEHVAPLVTYGWGVIPVVATIAGTQFRTSLFPRGEAYLLPLKIAVRRPLGIDAGDMVSVELELNV